MNLEGLGSSLVLSLCAVSGLLLLESCGDLSTGDDKLEEAFDCLLVIEVVLIGGSSLLPEAGMDKLFPT